MQRLSPPAGAPVGLQRAGSAKLPLTALAHDRVHGSTARAEGAKPNAAVAMTARASATTLVLRDREGPRGAAPRREVNPCSATWSPCRFNRRSRAWWALANHALTERDRSHRNTLKPQMGGAGVGMGVERSILRRERLLRVMRRRHRLRLLVLEAPAGFGRTT